MKSSMQDQRTTNTSLGRRRGGRVAGRRLMTASTMAMMAVLLAVSGACQQAPVFAEPYDVQIDEGGLQGHLTVEETGARSTRVRGELVAVPAGSYEAYFSSDGCETRGDRVTGFGLREVGDIQFTLEDQKVPYSGLSTGEHYLRVEWTSSGASVITVCIPLRP